MSNVIEEAITNQGFQLYRMKEKAKASG